MVYFKEPYCFPRFRRGSIVFQGVKLFTRVVVNMLISIETYRAYFFRGGGILTLSNLWIRACTHFLEFKAPFNYVETYSAL